MKSYLFVLLIIIICLNPTYSQVILWEKEIENPAFNNPMEVRAIEDNNGDYVCTVSESKERNFIILKLDKNGNTLKWMKVITEDFVLTNKYIQLDQDSNYLILNNVWKDTIKAQFYNNRVPQLLVIDTSGNIITERRNQGFADSVIFHNESYIDNRLINFVVDDKREFFIPYSRNMTDDNALISHVVGLKFKSDCQMLWKKYYDSVNFLNFNNFYIKDVARTLNEGFIILIQHSKDTKPVIKTELGLLNINKDGNLIWLKKHSISNTTYLLSKIIPCKDGKFLIRGQTKVDNNNNMTEFFWLFDKNGDYIIIEKYYQLSKYIDINKMIELPDSNYLEIGFQEIDAGSPSNMWDNIMGLYIKKINRELNILWEMTWKNQLGNCDLTHVLETKDGNILVVGITNPSFTSKNKLYIAKIKDTTLTKVEENDIKYSEINIYPNPFSNSFNLEFNNIKSSQVSLDLYNIIGNKIYSKDFGIIDNGIHSFSIDLDNRISPGIYFLKYKSANYIIIKKIIKLE